MKTLIIISPDVYVHIIICIRYIPHIHTAKECWNFHQKAETWINDGSSCGWRRSFRATGRIATDRVPVSPLATNATRRCRCCVYAATVAVVVWLSERLHHAYVPLCSGKLRSLASGFLSTGIDPLGHSCLRVKGAIKAIKL